MKKLEYIDFARGYAIFTIVIFHLLQRLELSPMLQKAIIFGGSGVHLFFLLSGLGLGMSRRTVSAGEFYRRRLAKVWVPYVVVLTLSALAASLLGVFSDGWDAWAAGVLLYQMFFEKYIQSFGGHFWFISAIVQFYLIFPLLSYEKQTIGSPWGFAKFTLLLSALWWVAVWYMGKGDLRVWNSCCLQFLWEFSLGMALADGIRQQNLGGNSLINTWLRGDFWEYSWWKSLLAGIFFTFLMILMILEWGEVGRIFNDIPALAGYTALSVFIFQVSRRWLVPVKNFFIWLGGFSFSFYLLHILVLEIWTRFFALRGVSVSLPMLVAYLVFMLGVAWAWEPVSQSLTHFFEKFLKKKDKKNQIELAGS